MVTSKKKSTFVVGLVSHHTHAFYGVRVLNVYARMPVVCAYVSVLSVTSLSSSSSTVISNEVRFHVRECDRTVGHHSHSDFMMSDTAYRVHVQSFPVFPTMRDCVHSLEHRDGPPGLTLEEMLCFFTDDVIDDDDYLRIFTNVFGHSPTSTLSPSQSSTDYSVSTQNMNTDTDTQRRTPTEETETESTRIYSRASNESTEEFEPVVPVVPSCVKR